MKLCLEFEEFTDEIFMSYLMSNDATRPVVQSPPGEHQFGKSKALLSNSNQRVEFKEGLVLLHKPTTFVFPVTGVSMRLDWQDYRNKLGLEAWTFFFQYEDAAFRDHFGNMAASNFGLSGKPSCFIRDYMLSKGDIDFIKKLILMRD